MKDIFINLLSHLRATALYYQTAHWSSKTALFYQDHLLFERLLGSVNEEIDGVAEKAVGLVGIDGISLLVSLKKVYEKVKTLPQAPTENAEFFKAALGLEQELINLCTETEKVEGITLGFKNLLADLVDNAEGRVYLIKQRLSK
jgi:DNA-binding ferritin-like protein